MDEVRTKELIAVSASKTKFKIGVVLLILASVPLKGMDVWQLLFILAWIFFSLSISKWNKPMSIVLFSWSIISMIIVYQTVSPVSKMLDIALVDWLVPSVNWVTFAYYYVSLYRPYQAAKS